ncbi:MAG: Gfo/Idh/MocA family oxidoreductase [Chloroflexi bacterium]|nr:Gfo/Idh/MocA family oxidoreductase [Chloroflexota bacterium]
MSLKVGLAGYGRRGRGHIRAINEIETARITSISDPVDTARDAALNELDDISVYASVGEMVDSGDVDAVIVAAPAHLNSVVAMDAIERGVPILIEKPPALSLQGVVELRDAADQSGSKVIVAFNRRCNPLIRAAIDVIRKHGSLRQIIAEFHKDIHDFTDDPRYSPEIFDLMLLESPIHSVDIVTHMAGAAVSSTNAIVKRTASPYRDVHAALIEFENEVVCQFTAAYTAGGRLERYELHGDYVSVYLEGVNQGWVLRGGERSDLEVPEKYENDGVAQARCFVESVVSGLNYPEPAATLETSIATLRLCESILDSVDSTVSAD